MMVLFRADEVWPGWLERINAARLVRSMLRKVSSQDNAACEGFFGRLKNEFVYPRDWRAFTVVQFIDEVETFIRGITKCASSCPLVVEA
jgi:transposase InsO family protein